MAKARLANASLADPSAEIDAINKGHAALVQQLYATYANAQLTAATDQDKVHADSAFTSGVTRAKAARQRALALL